MSADFILTTEISWDWKQLEMKNRLTSIHSHNKDPSRDSFSENDSI